jgi:PIN domain nuclease of toxin-antitoxin system
VSLLLDTHTFLWSILNDPRLSSTAANLILDPNHRLYLSAASYWELAIKISVGKRLSRNYTL